jgi:hypothetical protein
MKKLMAVFVFGLLIYALEGSAKKVVHLDKIRFIEGQWNLHVFFYDEGKWASTGNSVKVKSKTVFNGTFIRINLPIQFTGGMFEFEMTLSYDRFNERYRALLIDDLNGYLDLYSGSLVDNVLTVNNTDSGTQFPVKKKGFVYGKINFIETDNGFTMVSYVSTDKKTFSPYMQLVFTSQE